MRKEFSYIICSKCEGYCTVEQDEYGKITVAQCSCQKSEAGDSDPNV